MLIGYVYGLLADLYESTGRAIADTMALVLVLALLKVFG